MGKTDGRSSVARAITRAAKALGDERQKSQKLAEISSDALELASRLEELGRAEYELRGKVASDSASRIICEQRVEAGAKLRDLMARREKLLPLVR